MVEAHAEIEVRDLSGMHAAALRYFESGGPFAAAASAALGIALPAPLNAAVVALPAAPDSELVLAWSRPTETLLLTASATALAALAGQIESADGGQLVDVTGALAVLRLSGARSADLIGRLGSGSVPRAGEARRGRLADVPVMSLCVRAGEVWLIVDRAYARHLSGWIEATLADWAAGGSRAG
jgi:sarcosine oxidase gamma subunit